MYVCVIEREITREWEEIERIQSVGSQGYDRIDGWNGMEGVAVDRSHTQVDMRERCLTKALERHLKSVDDSWSNNSIVWQDYWNAPQSKLPPCGCWVLFKSMRSTM